MSLFDEVVQVPADIHRWWHSGKGLPYPGGYYNNWWWDKVDDFFDGDVSKVEQENIVSWYTEIRDNFNF